MPACDLAHSMHSGMASGTGPEPGAGRGAATGALSGRSEDGIAAIGPAFEAVRTTLKRAAHHAMNLSLGFLGRLATSPSPSAKARGPEPGVDGAQRCALRPRLRRSFVFCSDGDGVVSSCVGGGGVVSACMVVVELSASVWWWGHQRNEYEYTWPYPAFRIGHLVLVRQPYLLDPHSSDVCQAQGARRHVQRHAARAARRYRTLWDAVWIEPEELIDEGILVSPRMTEDHYTSTLLKCLEVREASR
jgi:hypothetical protein